MAYLWENIFEMKKITFILFSSLLLVTISCNEEKKTDGSQMKKVMAIHDEVMPEMSTIGNLVGELSELENDSTEIGRRYKESRKELQEAHKAMMDWMRGFGDRFDPDEILNGKKLTKQKQDWLNEEEKKVKALKAQINNSIASAKKLLNQD